MRRAARGRHLAFEDLSTQRPVKAELTAARARGGRPPAGRHDQQGDRQTLAISHRTVEIYRARLMRKYKASTTGRPGAQAHGWRNA